MTKKNKNKIINSINIAIDIAIDYLKLGKTTSELEEKRVYLAQAKRVIEEEITIANNELIKMQKRDNKLKK